MNSGDRQDESAATGGCADALAARRACVVRASLLLAAERDAQTQRISFSFEEPLWTDARRSRSSTTARSASTAWPFGGAATANATPAACRRIPARAATACSTARTSYVEVADNAALDITTELTVAAWIYLRTAPSELHTIVSKDTNFEYHIDSQRRAVLVVERLAAAPRARSRRRRSSR